MKTKAHWDETKNNQSYHTANKIALHLREIAKAHNLSQKSIRVLSKEDSYKNNLYADAVVWWPEGPLNWADTVELTPVIGISFECKQNKILIYDTFVSVDVQDDND